jgi:hypothetical protein
MEVAAEVDRVPGTPSGRRVEGDQRTLEGRQVDAEIAGEIGEPRGAPEA